MGPMGADDNVTRRKAGHMGSSSAQGASRMGGGPVCRTRQGQWLSGSSMGLQEPQEGQPPGVGGTCGKALTSLPSPAPALCPHSSLCSHI